MVQTFTFTSAGKKGSSGPSQSQINSAYKNTELEGKVTVTRGIQKFIVPQTGLYEITAYGAEGGTGKNNSRAGKGAIVGATFSLLAGTALEILVGQKGKDMAGSDPLAGGGGGGCSNVMVSNSSEPLILAGGGGGGGFDKGADGTDGLSGEIPNSSGYGIASKGSGGRTSDGDGGGAGAGGAGWRADGTSNRYTPGGIRLGLGGASPYAGYGGFGGGGSAYHGGGGGSGYTGGGGGNPHSSPSGGGGSSYVSALAKETTVLRSGEQIGDGLVTITLKSEPSLLLIQDGDIIKTYENNSWQNIKGGMSMPTVDEFKQHGMTDLSVIPESAWNQLESDNIKILVLTKDTSINSASVNVTAIPKRQLIMQETDMIFEKPIKSFTLTGTVQNESVLKIIASNDSGTTWKAFNGVSWHPVDISDLDDVKSKGMDIATFNGVTQEVWKPFLSGMKLRLTYYLDLHAVTDTLLIDKLAYETVPVVSNSPKLHSIKIETNSLTIEGRLKELERINAINIAKLNFKSNALLRSEKYKMHDMVIDTCESDSMKIIASSGAGETKQEVAFSNTVELGSGKVSALSLASITNIKKIEVK